ncbi:NUMOD4 motif-containing HNH endonuclease [Candidatus Pacearchaeota archaeon]|nr:NUMOD4 motif-containing HNH endonuclease [Candidatus Pacearchaeota archaeon]
MEWINIKGFEEFYQINILGKVRSLDKIVNNYPNCTRKLKGRILKGTIDKAGYYRVYLCGRGMKKNTLLHRLIALHFIPNPNDYPCVNHMDGVKTNNNISNLEWCTHKQNMRHGYDTGLIPKKINPKGEKGIAAKLTDNQVVEIKKRLAGGGRIVDIVLDYPVKEGAIGEIKAGRSWGHIQI